MVRALAYPRFHPTSPATNRSQGYNPKFSFILKPLSSRIVLHYENYVLQYSQGGCVRKRKMPTALVFFNPPKDTVNDSRPTLPLAPKTAHLSGRFVENKQDAPFFPLIMSGFDRRRPQTPLAPARISKPAKLRSKPIFPSPPDPPCPRLHAPTILTVYPGFQNL